MELTPLQQRRDYNRRREQSEFILGVFSVVGVQVRDYVLRRLSDGALRNLYQNLQAAGAATAQQVADTFRQITGFNVDNFEQIIGMSRRHKWGDVTQAPETFDKERLIKRISSIEKSYNAYSKSHPKDVNGIADRLKELNRWKDYLRDTFSSGREADTPASDNNEPNEIELDEARGQVRSLDDIEDDLDIADRSVRPRLEENQIQAPPGEQRYGLFEDLDQFIEEDPAFAAFDQVAALEPMALAEKAGIAGGGPAQQMACGRIGKNRPIRSRDGTQVIFSGSRQMYTWGYNFQEQKNPFSLKRELAYNSPGNALLKPLGHTVPWDTIGFYCTPAEWESLLWKTHRIEIEEVEVTITPIDKSVFFTTGSAEQKTVSTEHAAYVFKIEQFPENNSLMRVQPKGGVMAINWESNELLQPTDYAKMRDRLWGPVERSSTGFSCLDGVKRELETLECLLLDDPSKCADYGSFLIGEYQDVYPLTEVMGKPFIRKKYKPVCGLVNDPSTRVLMNRFVDTDSAASPFVRQKIVEDMLHEAAILAHKDHTLAFLKYKTKDSAMSVQDSAGLSLHGGPTTGGQLIENNLRIYAPKEAADPICKSATATIVNTIELKGKPFENAAGARYTYDIAAGDKTGAIDQFGAVLCAFKSGGGADVGMGWGRPFISNTGIKGDLQIPTGKAIAGNSGKVVGAPQVGLSVSGETGITFTEWTQELTLDKDLNQNYGDSSTYYLQQWHSKIEKGNSFIPMGADRDNFPRVVEEQPKFSFGLKPVIATDPNTAGQVDYLKAQVNWKIEYKMKIKQTYVEPQLRFVEKRSLIKTTDTRLGPFTLPDVPNYSNQISPYGLQVSVSATGKFKKAGVDKTVSFDISEQNHLERDLTYNNRVFQSIRTAPVYDPNDVNVFPNSVQSGMTNTPMVLNENKLA